MVVPALLAAILCVVAISARSLWLDEAATVAIASQHGGALGGAIARDGGNMLGYYALLHVLIGWFGDGPLVLRLPSALAASTAVALTGLLGLRLFDRRVAFAGGLLMAVSLPLVFWGQTARGYAPMVALIGASFVAFVALTSDARSRWGAWIGYATLTTLAVYAGLIAVIVVPAQLVMLWWRRDAAARVASALAVSALCCVPLAVLAANRGSGQLFWVPRPSVGGAKQVLEALTSAGLEPNFHATATTTALLVLTVALVVGAAVVAVAPGASWASRLVLTWAVLPTLLALVESLIGQSIFLPRNAVVSLPAVALLLAWGLVGRRGRTLGPLLAWSFVVGLIALRALALAPSYAASPENWRAATAYVTTHSRAGDCIAFYPSDGRMAFDYYVRGLGRAPARVPRPVLPTAPWSQVRPYLERYVSFSPAELARLPAACPRLWLVSSHEGQPDGPPLSRAHNREYLALVSALGRDYRTGPTASFGWAGAVRVRLFWPARRGPLSGT